MAQTLAEVLTTIRDQIQDTYPLPRQRHSDAKLVRYLNLALGDAYRLRPDIFIPEAVEIDYTYTTADLALTFPVEFGFVSPFIDFVCGMVSVEDDEFVMEGRAMALLTRFGQKLVGRGV